MKPWKNSNGEPNLKGRWLAAQEFLTATLQTGTLWDDAVKKGKAWDVFRKHGDIDVPSNVKVICVDPDLAERDKLVVFIMPSKGATVSPIDPLAYWVTAWPPYGGESKHGKKKRPSSRSKARKR